MNNVASPSTEQENSWRDKYAQGNKCGQTGIWLFQPIDIRASRNAKKETSTYGGGFLDPSNERAVRESELWRCAFGSLISDNTVSASIGFANSLREMFDRIQIFRSPQPNIVMLGNKSRPDASLLRPMTNVRAQPAGFLATQ